MLKSRLWAGIFFVLTCLLVAGCTDEGANKEEVEAEVSDEAILAVVEMNVEKLMAKDLDGYMETIHSESPVYETTEETITELFNYTLDIELQNLEIKEQTDKEVIVAYTQRTVETEAGDFQNNETTGEHTLRLDDGQWKIYNSEVIAVNPLPQEEQEMEQETVEMAGEYAAKLESVAKPFDEEEWILSSYKEAEGAATAVYLPEGENLGNYSQIITYDFYEDGNIHSDLAHFIDVFEQSLNDMATVDVEFQRFNATETEVSYQFALNGDPTEPDQEEIGRVFILDDDMYVVRYTKMDSSIENRDEVVDMLREIQ